MSRYRLHPAASVDLDAIYDYVAERNPPAAVRLLESFQTKFDFLADHPHTGEIRNELRSDIRSFAAGSYVIFYRPTAAGIEIARSYILHEISARLRFQNENTVTITAAIV